MDDRRFDALTRSFGRGISRRQVISALGAAVISSILPSGLTSAASCRKAETVCRKNGDCCSGLCSEKDSRGRSYCICPAGTENCKRNCVDPAAAYSSDPNNCGGCGIVCPNSNCGIGVCNAGVCGIGPDSRKVGRSCDDSNSCTTNDVCQVDGSCAGSPVPCTVTEPKCQSATCNPATGQCETTNFALGTGCADDDRCDGEEACDGNGVCVQGTPVTCPTPTDSCKSAICDSTTGLCSEVPKPDLTACGAFGIPNGYCCSGLCSQCCGDASVCTGLFGETENFVVTCQDPTVYGNINCLGGCDPDVIPPTNPICTNPAVLAGVNQLCIQGQEQVTCLNCRLPVGSLCSFDTQCCGFCVNGTCQDGAAGSSCAEASDCAAGLVCNAQSLCEAPLPIGAACVAVTSTCVAGATCGTIIGSNVDTFCCLPIDSACSADEECCQQNGGVQERCILGTCRSRGLQGDSCGKDFDCAGVLTCISGICGFKSLVGETCDSNGDCAFDQTSNTQPICANGVCGLPNGAPTDSANSCAGGARVQCDYGWICGECCTRDVLGFDPVFCGDQESEKICCNHNCIFRNNDTHCGACDVDCTCGGTDPYRYCSTTYQTDVPSWDWPAVCKGTYTESSGHCSSNNDFCSTTCPPPAEPCDCTQPVSSLFCYASCVGSFPDLELSTCANIGGECLDGNNDTCCGDAICSSTSNCSPGVVFCLSNDYKCVSA